MKEIFISESGVGWVWWWVAHKILVTSPEAKFLFPFLGFLGLWALDLDLASDLSILDSSLWFHVWGSKLVFYWSLRKKASGTTATSKNKSNFVTLFLKDVWMWIFCSILFVSMAMIISSICYKKMYPGIQLKSTELTLIPFRFITKTVFIK